MSWLRTQAFEKCVPRKNTVLISIKIIRLKPPMSGPKSWIARESATFANNRLATYTIFTIHFAQGVLRSIGTNETKPLIYKAERHW